MDFTDLWPSWLPAIILIGFAAYSLYLWRASLGEQKHRK